VGTGAADTLRRQADSSPEFVALVEFIARLHAEVSQAKDDARRHSEAAVLWQERARVLADRLALAVPMPPDSPGAANLTPDLSDLTPDHHHRSRGR
jgi:hypothetical protein